MTDEKWAVIAVQAVLTLLLVVGTFYLMVTEHSVPEWWVGLCLLAAGSWFGSGLVVRRHNNIAKREAVRDRLFGPETEHERHRDVKRD